MSPTMCIRSALTGTAIASCILMAAPSVQACLFSSVASAFGAAGSLVLILVWVYYASQILLFGAVVTHVIAARHQRAPAETAEVRADKNRSAEMAAIR